MLALEAWLASGSTFKKENLIGSAVCCILHLFGRQAMPRGSTFSDSKIEWWWDFPGGAVVGNLPASTGNTGLSPGPGRSHMPRSN